jgi:hypothetical protein
MQILKVPLQGQKIFCPCFIIRMLQLNAVKLREKVIIQCIGSAELKFPSGMHPI